MTTLSIQVEQIAAIKTHAVSTYPEECCGILLGQMHTVDCEITRTVVELWPVTNTWGDEAKTTIAVVRADSTEQELTAERRYWIDPRELLAAQKAGRNRNLQVIGIYHSHPDHPAVPSECDRVLAWPDYSYIIVSVLEGKSTDVLSWALNDNHQFQPETVQIV
ncbi:MAG: M67 family metallopeptidase [Cyanothece sp. SIO2G6]|nr:M67 family metallopeptidase [Cyanothece sp. SIO2G6]